MALARKTIAKVKRLREDALRRVSDGRFQDAAPLYEELTRLEPDEGEWPRRAADCYWHLKKPELRLEYSIVAARAYSRTGLLLKAIAMCKVALSVDPDHTETQQDLAHLYARQPHYQTPAVPAAPSGYVAPLAVDPPSRVPTPKQTAPKATLPEHQVLKMRARMAAAATLRRLRTERQQQVIFEEASQPSAERTTLGRIALRAKQTPLQAKEVPHGARQRSGASLPKRPGAPLPQEEPPIPSLRLDSPVSDPCPALDEMRISERLPGKTVPSLAPLRAVELDSPRDVGYPPSVPLPTIEPDSWPDSSPREGPIAAPHSLAPLSLLDPEIRARPDVPAQETEDQALALKAEVILPEAEEHTTERFLQAQTALKSTSLFDDLDEETLRHLISELTVVELKPNEVLFQQGDLADSMYVVAEGQVSATVVTSPEQAPLEMATLEEGEFFGEIGLLSDQPRQTTVRALMATRLLRFDRGTIGRVIDFKPEFLQALLHFLKVRLVELLTITSPLFSPFMEEERRSLTKRFEFLEVAANTVLLDHGQYPIGMYVLLTGRALLENPKARAGALRHLGPGAIFGEQALLHNRVAQIQVRTTKKCFALCLPSDSFSELIMTHPTILEYLSTLDEEHTAERDQFSVFDHMTFY